MKFVVLRSNDTRDTLYKDTAFGTRLYSDENGKDPSESASKAIWERMTDDLDATCIERVELNGEVVFSRENSDVDWEAVEKESIDELKTKTYDEIKAKYGLLTHACVIVRSCDDLLCGIFHRAIEREPNSEDAEPTID